MRRFTLAALGLLLAFASVAPAQELTAEQQEVWTAFEQEVALWVSGDMEANYEFVHPDFVWWNSGNSVPGDYDAAWILDNGSADYAGKWVAYDLTPLTILVYDDFAVLNAYMRGFREDRPGGDAKWTTLRLHNDWKKDDGRWRLVANYIDFE